MVPCWACSVGCGIERPVELPPPPAEATASCVYETTPPLHVGVSTSTLWFNGLGQTIRIDGRPVWHSGNTGLAPYYITYDDQGRIVEERSDYGDVRYDYTPQQITQTSDTGPRVIYSLVEGRVAHSEYPADLPIEKRSVHDYTYDSAGRIASYSASFFPANGQGTMRVMFVALYTYDPQGRVVTHQLMKNGEITRSESLTYSETPDRLVIRVDDGSSVERWTYDFDASHRVIRSAINYFVPFYPSDLDDPDDIVDVYSYLDGEIVESFPRSDGTIRATGACPPPAVVTAPVPPLPIGWYADYVSLSNAAASAFSSIDLPR